MYVDIAEKPIWCLKKQYQIPLLRCLSCNRFPCDEKHVKLLEESKFTEMLFKGFINRRCNMYIFKYYSGELKEAPDGFNPDNPDFSILQDVDEVLCINKILTKQMKLVAKSKEEIKKIRNTVIEQQQQPKKKARRQSNGD